MNRLRVIAKKSMRIFAVGILLSAQVSAYAGFINNGEAEAILYQNYCTADQQGKDDVAGADDIQQGCYTYSAGGATAAPAFVAAWSWDDSDFTNATSQACALLDKNSNGNADLAFCGNVSGSTPSATYTFYECNDTASRTCGSPTVQTVTPFTIPGTSTQLNVCTLNATSLYDPFDFSPDTLAFCIFDPAEFGVSSNTQFIDVCSYSTPPTTDPIDCIFATPNEATLTLSKSFFPTYSPGTVSLTVEGTVHASSVSHGGSTGPVTIPTNEGITIGENATGGTDLNDFSTSFTCSIAGVQVWSSSGATGSTSRSRTIPQGIIDDGDNVSCTITNVIIGNGIDISKTVDNTNGGDAEPSDFSFIIEGYNSNLPIQFESDGTNSLIIPNGTYDIYEVEENEDGYITTYSGCQGVVIDENSPVFENCEITNTAQPATITIVKTVTNDNGGEAEADEFVFRLNGTDITSQFVYSADGLSANASVEVPAGTYSVTEDADSRYTTTYSSDCTAVELGIGESVTCTILNDDRAGQIQIVKELIQDNGGAASVEDFSFRVNGGSPVFFNSSGSVTLQVDKGQYSITEDTVFGYDTTYDNCNELQVENGDTLVCTITNDDQQAMLTLIKQVITDDGGQLGIEDFVLFVTDASSDQTIVESGIAIMLDAGTYTAQEIEVEGWTASDWMGDCGADGSITLSIGGMYSCTITNDDEPATVTIQKELTQNNGGVESVTDFGFTLTDANLDDTIYNFPTTGSVTLVLPAGTYSISENGLFGYDTTSSCGDITLANGQVTTCTIASDDIAPVVEIEKISFPCFSSQEFSFSFAHNDGQLYDEFLLSGGCQSEMLYELPLSPEVMTRYDTSQNGPAGSLIAGDVVISESFQSGWFQDEVACFNQSDEMEIAGEIGTVSFVTEIGKSYRCIFTNIQSAEVTVYKFHDYNEDGEKNEDEPLLNDWEVGITPVCEESSDMFIDNTNCPDSMTGVTASGQGYTFEGVEPGVWSLFETQQDEWVQSAMYCVPTTVLLPQLPLVSAPLLLQSSEDDELNISVPPGSSQDCFIGNHKSPKINISKSSSPSTPVVPSQEIVFELTVSVPDVNESGKVYGNTSGPEYVPVTVVDNLQDEFDYVANSFSAISSTRGDLVDAGITTDPNYQSPGRWFLTNSSSNFLTPGEVITLRYRAVVGNATQAGTYPTTASVTGFGTNAAITATNTTQSEVTVRVPAVLGASSSISGTGKSAHLQQTGFGSVWGVVVSFIIVSFTMVLWVQRRPQATL